MKKIYLFLLIFLFSNLSYSQWYWQNPLPQGNHLRAVYFLNSSTGWAAGNNGSVIHTIDGGVTWAVQNTKQQSDLKSIRFIDPLTGWAVGKNGTIVKTIDAGYNWSRLISGVQTDLNSVYFVNGNNGTAVGDGGIILRTVNGGNSWFIQNGFPVQDYRNVFFLNGVTGWIIGKSGALLKSLDGGSNWAILPTVTGENFSSIYFYDQNFGYIAGNTIKKTFNGGVAWQDVFSSGSTLFNFAQFLSDPTGWAIATGELYKTTNSGQNWNTLNVNPQLPLNFYTGYFSDLSNGILVGDGGAIYKTINGGTDWSLQTGGQVIYDGILAFDILTPFIGWACGGDGRVFRTNDGATWNYSVIPGEILTDISFPQQSTGWTVSRSGKLYKSTDGGSSWSEITYGAPAASLYEVVFTDASSGWIGGSKFYKTTDGGASWTQQFPDFNFAIKSLSFVDPQTGFAAGGLRASRTFNGGMTWAQLPFGFTDSIECISFADANTGWAACLNGKLYKTTSGGIAWQLQQAGTSSINYHSVHMLSSQTGYLSGTGGAVFKTVNGGNNWVQQNRETHHDLFSIFFFDENTGWTGGYFGTILKTTNGGGTVSINNISNDVPSVFILFQNYPNPFNPVTVIKYWIRSYGEVSMKIFDITGREVTTLFSGKQNPGTYTVEFKGDGLPSGIYYYRLQSGKLSQTRKMVLVK